MIDRTHRVSISGQARLLGLSRGSVYYQRRPPAAADVALRRQLDEVHVESPFAGSRMLRDLLRQEGHEVGRLHDERLRQQWPPPPHPSTLPLPLTILSVCLV